jgi:hypothetical protein
MSEPQYDAEDMHRYYDMVEWRDLQKQRDELLAALKLALPCVLDHESEANCRLVLAAIANAEGK